MFGCEIKDIAEYDNQIRVCDVQVKDADAKKLNTRAYLLPMENKWSNRYRI